MSGKPIIKTSNCFKCQPESYHMEFHLNEIGENVVKCEKCGEEYIFDLHMTQAGFDQIGFKYVGIAH